MKKGNGKSKGNNFERNISRKLSLWLTNNESDNMVWRTDTSGGRSTIKMKQNKMDDVIRDNIGDLKKVCERGKYEFIDMFFDKFLVELKCGYGNTFDFYPPFNKGLIHILYKSKKEAFDANKCLFLVVKADRKKILVISDFQFCIESKLEIHIDIDFYYIYLLDELIEHNLKSIIFK